MTLSSGPCSQNYKLWVYCYLWRYHRPVDCEVGYPENRMLCVSDQAWRAFLDHSRSCRRPRPYFELLSWTWQLVVQDPSAFLDLQLQRPMSTLSCSRSSHHPALNRESNMVAVYHIWSVDLGTQSSRPQPRLLAPFGDVFEGMWLAVRVARAAQALARPLRSECL